MVSYASTNKYSRRCLQQPGGGIEGSSFKCETSISHHTPVRQIVSFAPAVKVAGLW